MAHLELGNSLHYNWLKLGQLMGRRFRMQCLADSSLHFGWIEEISQPYLKIRVTSPREIKNGDFFQVEASGSEKTICFMGQVLKQDPDSIVLNVSSDVTESELDTDTRVKCTNMPGTIRSKLGLAQFIVEDISKNGIGGFADANVEKGLVVEVQVQSSEGTIILSGEVRYSRADRKQSGRFRVGIEVYNSDRVSQARLSRIFNANLDE